MAQQPKNGDVTHMAFLLSDIGRAFEYLKEHGFQIIDTKPRKNCAAQVFFIHPGTTDRVAFGYVMEIADKAHAYD